MPAGRSPEELAREFDPTVQTIQNWLDQADRDKRRGHDGLSISKRQEVVSPRRENMELRLERDTPAMAAI